jgi:hypothetical protein
MGADVEIFSDFGFVGGDDQTANPFQDNQICLNWYPEISPSQSAKVPVSLLGAPGLIQLVSAGPTLAPSGALWPMPSAVTNLPVRGCWVLPGGAQALAIAGNLCYLVTIETPATQFTPAVLTGKTVGRLLTSAGSVSLRDNGLGGYVVIVDGPNYYLYNIAAQTFAQGTDPAWLGSDTVAFIDGWWIFQQPGTQTFYTNAQPYSTALNGSYFANADATSDQLLAVWESKEELWLIKEKTTEIWYDAGGQYFPFQRLVGTPLQVGCKAVYSIARLSSQGQDGLIWFARSERGENIVVRTQGFLYQVISTPAVSAQIAKYNVTSDAIGYTYQEGTHEFYVLTFPTADKTWVFDVSVPTEMSWTQRASYDPYAKAFHRHRSNCYMNFAGMRIVGDYQNGSLYQMTRSAYTDAGWPILARRRAPYIWDKGARGRVFMASLQIEFAPGQGTSSGLGANPQANLRISHNGVTFGQQWPAPMGSIGNFNQRTLWRRLSFGRSNLVEVEVIAPVNRDIVGATLHAFAAQASA